MKKVIFILALLIVTLLQALPEDTWIIDGNNSIPEQLTWTAKYWGYIYRSDTEQRQK